MLGKVIWWASAWDDKITIFYLCHALTEKILQTMHTLVQTANELALN